MLEIFNRLMALNDACDRRSSLSVAKCAQFDRTEEGEVKIDAPTRLCRYLAPPAGQTPDRWTVNAVKTRGGRRRCSVEQRECSSVLPSHPHTPLLDGLAQLLGRRSYRCSALAVPSTTQSSRRDRRPIIASLRHGLGRGAGLLSSIRAQSPSVPTWARQACPRRRQAHNSTAAPEVSSSTSTAYNPPAHEREDDPYNSAAQDRWAHAIGSGSGSYYAYGQARLKDVDPFPSGIDAEEGIAAEALQEPISSPSSSSRRTVKIAVEDKIPARRPASKTILNGGLSQRERAQRKAQLKRIAETIGITEANATQRRFEKEDALRKQRRKEMIVMLRPYMERQMRLIQLEAEEQRQEVEIRKSWSLSKLTKEGWAIDGLEGYWLQKDKERSEEEGAVKPKKKSRSFSAIRTAVFHRPGKARFGWTRLQKGDQVELKKSASAAGPTGAEGEEPSQDSDDFCVGTVRSISENELRLNFEMPFHDLDLLAQPLWLVEMAYNDLIEQRLVQSVEALVHDVEASRRAGAELSGTPLVHMLLDEGTEAQAQMQRYTVAQWIEEHCAHLGEPDFGNLNETQREAVRLMLSQPISLVQGPPGTGKTSTIVAAIRLLKQHYKIPHTILLTSHTNVAVDNLAQGCKDAGLNIIRAGAPIRVRESLSDVTVEGLLDKHPSKPRLDELGASRIATIKALQNLQGLAGAVVEAPANYETGVSLEVEQELESDVALLFGAPQHADSRTEVQRLQKKLSLLMQKSYVLRREMEKDIYENVDVVCCTAMSAPLLRVVDFPLVFFDEASMAIEPVTIATMIKGCQQLSLIGDQQQLSPLVKSREVQDEGLGISLFERLMEGGKLPNVMLDTQHRMHPSLSDFPNHEFYQGRLRDADTTASLRPIQSSYVKADMHLSFVNHKGRECVTKNKSLENNQEADLIVKILADVLCKNEDLTGADVGIITPYLGQKELLWKAMQDPMSYHRNLLSTEVERLGGSKSRLAEIGDVEIHTIDGFEGREKKVVIMSLVRANAFRYLGFLKEEKRWNVALTRAKNALIIVGNASMLERGKTAGQVEEAEEDTFLHRYADHLRQHDCILDVDDVQI